MRKLSKTVLLTFLLCLSSWAVENSITFINVSPNQSVQIPSIDSKFGTQIALNELFSAMGYTISWDQSKQKLQCTKKGSAFTFVQDMSFCTFNNVVVPLFTAPQKQGTNLFAPVSATIDLAKSSGIAFGWESIKKILTVKKSNFSIESISIEKKTNGTLALIKLSDSLLYEFTYVYPNLTFNFYNGKVDTSLFKKVVVSGLVDSVFALQFKQSAQVSLILKRQIEEPQIDYMQDSKMLLVSMRPKKVAPRPIPVQSQPQTTRMSTIVIDPGHGGKDPGAIGINGVKEKEVVLSIGLMARDLLKKKASMNIFMTRSTDVFIPLADRTAMANKKGADLFVSIHADAIPPPLKRQESIKGYKIYFLSQAKNEEDKLVAMRENAVIELEDKPQKYSNLQNVLIDLAGNEFLRESQDLCILFDKEFEKGLQNKISKSHLGVGQANFWVLNGAYMPSVLIETGFLSNSKEEKLLADKQVQKAIAQSICDAILLFVKQFERNYE